MTPGEIQRWLERIDKNIDSLREEVQARHHKLSGEVTAVVGPISTLTLRMDRAESSLSVVQKEVQGLMLRSAALSAVIAFAGFLLGLWFKH